MIPQPLKWVAAIVVMAIALVVVTPFALDAMLGTVEFEDDSGLFATDDEIDPDNEGLDPLESVENDAGEPEDDGEGAGEDGEDGEGADEDEPAEDTPDTYVVEAGDTLHAIAEEVYGDGSRWEEIADANGIDDRSALAVGMELEIP